MANRLKIVTVVGARPQFIKLALLSREIRKRHQEILVHTGQHYDSNMSDIFFKELRLPLPDYNLGIIADSQGEQAGRMLTGIEKVLLKEKPDLVMVYGDTNSTLAGALAAVKLGIPLAHIEAGLRSYNRVMPEEINRVVADRVSEFLFCPTKTAVDNLKKEGIVKNVFLVGDVMYDNLLYYLPIARKRSRILKKLNLEPGSYNVLTIHRAENTQDLKKLKKILMYIDNLKVPTVFPIHPRTKNFLGSSFRPKKKLRLISPVAYLDMLILEENARAIFTDSGGMQKEAYILKVPCFTLRQETEWLETLKHGCNHQVNIDRSGLSLLKGRYFKAKSQFNPKVYGDGHAARKIVRILEKAYQ